MIAAILQPGFLQSDPVHIALLSGAVVAVISGPVGVFTVIRGQSFAGEALSDLGTLGGSSALLLGVTPFAGFVSVGVIVAATMELFGVQRKRGRDVVTGIVLGLVFGLSALCLYFDGKFNSTTGATTTILFGSLFTVAGNTLPLMLLFGAAALLALAMCYRPLMLSSLSPDLASSRGLNVRFVGVVFLVLVAVSVSLSSVVVGTILSTALLIGPAATALRLTKRPLAAMVAASVIGVVTTWLGVFLAFNSYDWPPSHHGWPVSFFIVTAIFTAYLMSGVNLSKKA